tara:strand:+ start:951 stop:1148 length:198 start_codon:yes stop_codon:yes gene_type:complete
MLLSIYTALSGGGMLDGTNLGAILFLAMVFSVLIGIEIKFELEIRAIHAPYPIFNVYSPDFTFNC